MGCLVCLIIYHYDHLSSDQFHGHEDFSKNKKKRIWSGVICILLTPAVFFLTGLSVSPFDPYGFGTGIIMMIYGAFFALNGIGIIVTGLFL